ncbi:MAG: alpha/beta fold hydrolase [Deltaproteobacteria bacterium]|nr:alpha/beta fold hydrolase [Deltaproteobacteria bacterium]
MGFLAYGLLWLAGAYILLSLILAYIVQAYPRKPVIDQPDWGRVFDTRIPAVDGGSLEVWRIEPDGPSRGTVVLAHGWSRNRNRMVGRARIFGKLGFTTILHSARDHGNSSPRRFMNAMKFSEDIESVLNWVGSPVILYGHSAGAAGAILATARNAHRIQLLFLEGCYAYTKEALLSLYRWFNRYIGACFGPAIIFWMDLFYRSDINLTSPALIAPEIPMPVMVIHGEKDQRFPVSYAHTLRNSFKPGQAEIYVAPGAGHSGSSQTPGYVPAIKGFLERHHAAVGR